MELTEEQLERIRKNRERAFELQRKRAAEREGAILMKGQDGENLATKVVNDSKRRKTDQEKEKEGEEEEELEEFEVGGSEWVTKAEAMKVYCLPEGTLAVCQVQEKKNPKHTGWTPMKLYNRKEIRRRARARHGGIVGLVAERKKRANKRFEKDLKRNMNLFE